MRNIIIFQSQLETFLERSQRNDWFFHEKAFCSAEVVADLFYLREIGILRGNLNDRNKSQRDIR